ncbi:MAG: tRNA (adenosine(37)-N6)-threonylcarbamoyltransferase complex ATPase subunit type 1 TsaE, partial [Fimbriimonas sp.]
MPKSQVPDYNCATPEETQAVGAALARNAQPGDLFLLEGELGAGKTTLVRGFLNELGWTGAVRSPTFTLLNLYETNPPVLHADLYRV